MIQATALANFTDYTDENNSNMVLWADGEFASIADRDINASGEYNTDAILRDAGNAFAVTNIDLEFDQNKDAETTLLFTQPYKRTIVQLKGTSSSYANVDLTDGVYQGEYGKFSMGFKPYDLAEGTVVAGSSVITSPATGSSAVYNDELQAIPLTDMMNAATNAGFTSKEGFLDAKPVGEYIYGIPSQMNGSIVAGDEQTNWSYTPTTK